MLCEISAAAGRLYREELRERVDIGDVHEGG